MLGVRQYSLGKKTREDLMFNLSVIEECAIKAFNGILEVYIQKNIFYFLALNTALSFLLFISCSLRTIYLH